MSKQKKSPFPGSIYVRNNKLYLKIRGKRLSTGLEDTPAGRKTANELLETYYRQDHNMAVLRPSKKLVYEVYQEFLDTHCLKLQHKTVVGYTTAFRAIVRSNFALNLDNISQAVRNFCATTSVNRTSQNNYLRHFSKFLTFCASRTYLPETDICKEYSHKVPPKMVQIFKDDEIEALVKYFEQRTPDPDPEFALLIQFAVETGWRIGEILTLKWTNVTDEAVHRISKDKRSLQAFPMTKNLASILAKCTRSGEKVFRWQDTSRSSLLRRLNAAMDELGIEKKNRAWHTFRKTARKRWMDMRLPMEYVKRLMGHSDIRVTEKHYTVVYTSEMREMLDQKSHQEGGKQ
ncbi:MAG: hypothetical protein EAZ92_14980 [Candidatus Kapaibacterium sp.]|nr:MAG: hypothetical protein EAZ92_14980 [Candidatus Kapabacteria bacterium]